MIFTLTDREYNVLDAYETDNYLIGIYIGTIIKSLDINVLVKSENAQNWTYGNYIMCQDETGYKYWFTIYDAEDSYNGDEKNLTCYSGTIDIVSEDANPVTKPVEPQPFMYYFNRIFNDTGITIGINELTGLSRSLEYTSESVSNAEMLQYVLNGFDNAEADLAVEFKGSTPTALVLNVFKRIGEEEPQITLTDEDDSLTSLNRTGSISDLATCLNPVGANEEDTENPITLVGKYYEELDGNGNRLYYSPTNHARVYSVEGRRNFYVQLPNKKNEEFDGYINRRYTSQASSQDALWKESLAQLKKIDQPTVTYEAKGSIDCQIGDNIQIISNEMQPPVMISARVLEYKFNDDDSTLNEYKFGNYQDLESNIDDLSKMMAEIKKSIVFISSQVVDYAIDNQGSEPPIKWVIDRPTLILGNWLWTRTVTNLSNGDQTVAYSVSYAGTDGEQGPKGETGATGERGLQGLEGNQGLPGPKGADGKSSYTHIAYATNSTGTAGFSISDSFNKTYIGMYVDFTESDSTNPSLYNWTLIKGSDGSQGIAGPTGANGQTSYLHIAYATNSTGTAGFSTTISTGKNYIGQYTDFTSTDSSTSSLYSWTLIKGETGATGPSGQTGATGPTGPAGQNAITGYLTNESLVLPANPSGIVSSFSGANGYLRVMDGNDQALSGITFSLASATGVTTTINSAGYFSVTAMSADFGTATYKAVYKGVIIEKIIMVVKNKQGVTGATGATGSQGSTGPATGITIQTTVPSGPYVGMLWKHTGSVSGYIKDVTYRWSGSKWEVFLFSVENLSVTNLAAISSTLGNVINPFSGVQSEGAILDGNTTIANGQVEIAGTVRGSTQKFSTSINPISLYGYITGTDGTINTEYLLSSAGLRLYNKGIGVGNISAEQLIAVDYKPIPLASGFATKEGNTPYYRVTRRMDMTHQCELVGQVGAISGNINTSLRYFIGNLPYNARPLRNEFFQAAGDRLGGRLAILTDGRIQLSPAESTDYMGLTCSFICNGPL